MTKSGVRVTGKMKFETVDSLLTSLFLKNTFNGADYTGLSFGFINGTFAAFSQDRSYFKDRRHRRKPMQRSAFTADL